MSKTYNAKYPFPTMQPGDFFEVSGYEAGKAAAASASSYGKRHGVVFSAKSHNCVTRIVRMGKAASLAEVTDRITSLLADCGMTSAEIGNAALDLTTSTVMFALREMSASKLVTRSHSGIYRLNAKAKAEMVPPRVVNLLNRPALSPRHIPSALGNRPGSNDHKQWQSRYL